MSILEKINSPEDVKRLSEAELAGLCRELRETVVNTTAKTGGHLSSNLGVVELTVAIHLVFDTSRDRLLFDVGHQSYIHKLLTGRRDSFGTLRSFGGISGFPKPNESVHDAFVAGHASSAVSTGLGMARARTLLGEEYNVIAVVGDGALAGGLTYEGLGDAGASPEPFIVVLNDNGMSIDKSVGGMALYLSRLRLRHGYIAFKNAYRRFMNRFSGGRWLYNIFHRIKQGVKEAVFNCSVFEDMGFMYIGPVDGHNIKSLTAALKIARDAKGPALVHVITKKGKGYQYAEANPDAFHGVRSFDPATGVIPASGACFSSVFGEELCKLAAADERIMAVTAAMPSGTGLSEFAARYPNRFFDVGICEGHAASMIGGAAERGCVPVFAVYSTFLQRSYDMLLQDVAMGREHAVLAVDRAGLSGEDGETHQGSMDVSFLTSMPNMTVWSPASFAELRDMLRHAVLEETGPVAVRYPKGSEGGYTQGGAEPALRVREGNDFTIVTYGISVNTALSAAELLEKRGISVDIIKLGRIKPIDYGPIEESARRTGRLLVLEEAVAGGCIGQQAAAELAARGVSLKTLILKNLGDRFIPHGTVEELRRFVGIDARSVAEAIAANSGKQADLGGDHGKDET